MLCFLVFAVLTVMAEYTIPSAFLMPTNEVPWWMAAQNKEKVALIDHYGKTNVATRLVGQTSNVSVSGSHQGIRAVVSPDLQVLKYIVPGVSIEFGWSIAQVCPGIYNLETNKFYSQMTDAEKTELWVAYTNKVIQAALAEEAEARAPAKFDISMSVEEYKASILGDRVYDDLTPSERREVNRKVAVYEKEWIRINDPEKYDREYRGRLFPSMHRNVRTEQEKIKSSRGWEARKRYFRAIREKRKRERESQQSK